MEKQAKGYDVTINANNINMSYDDVGERNIPLIFIHGFPLYCISIALLKNDIPVLGIVYESNTKELFTSIKGNGAFLNTNQIFVSKNKKLSDSLLATGFPYSTFSIIDTYLNSLKIFMDKDLLRYDFL